MPSPPPSPPALRRLLAAGALAFVVALAAASALGSAWAQDLAQPGVRVLGTGRGLAVLVTAGEARLLILTGDDGVAFGNALSRARRWTTGRIDVVLIGSPIADAAILREADTLDARYIAYIGQRPRADLLAGTRLADLETIDRARRFVLPSGLTVTLEIVRLAAQADDPPAIAWRAAIDRGRTRVLVLSDGSAVGDFPWSGPVAALVLLDGNAEPALREIKPRALVVSAESVEGAELRNDIAPALAGETWAIRVFPGYATRLDFIDRGLALPGEAVALHPSSADPPDDASP